jgi:hypothetical protein
MQAHATDKLLHCTVFVYVHCVNKVEAVTLSFHYPYKEIEVYVFVKVYLKVLSVLMNCEHF